MKTRLFNIFEKLRSGFWFLPGIITLLGAVLAIICLRIDATVEVGAVFDKFRWFKEATADGIRSLLTTIATSVLTIAGVSFSVTSVSFQLASQQFGSRLVRNFIRAPQTQTVLGALLGTFIFCALVLRATQGGENANVPQISGMMALVLSMISLALFIRFIDHTAQSIQADHVIRNVYDDLDSLIEQRFPTSKPDPAPATLPDNLLVEVSSDMTGYIEAIGSERLVKIATEHDVIIHVCHRAGDFVHNGAVLAKVHATPNPREASSDEDRGTKISKHVSRSLYIGTSRTPEQDFEFCVQQLVEISLRALSPGVNDPVTAMSCADYLSAALAKVTSRYLPPQVFDDAEGDLRLILNITDYDGLLGAAFDQLRQEAVTHCDVACRMLEGFAKIASVAREPEQRESISVQAELLYKGSTEHAATERERDALSSRYEKVAAAFRSECAH